MNLLVWKETRRCPCMRGLRKDKWDSVCTKRPGRAAIATSGEPAGAGSLRSD